MTEASGSAFGLRIVAGFEAPGLAVAPVDAAPARRRVALGLGEVRRWQTGHVVAKAKWAGASLEIERAEDGALGFAHSYFGRFVLSADATELWCRPSDLPEWQWQRFIVGQMLPAAALAHGLGPMHCSAIVAGGGATLLLGTSGAGKTTTMLSLVSGGAEFLADDVATLEEGERAVMAHPGSGLCNVGRERGAATGTSVGRVLGTWDDESRLQIDRVHPGPVEVRRVCLLVRTADQAEIRVRSPDPEVTSRLLLGAHFNATLAQQRDPRVWLELVSRLARQAEVRIVHSPLDGDPARVAEAVVA